MYYAMPSSRERLTNKAKTSVSMSKSYFRDIKEYLTFDTLNAHSAYNYLASISMSNPIFDMRVISDNSLRELSDCSCTNARLLFIKFLLYYITALLNEISNSSKSKSSVSKYA